MSHDEGSKIMWLIAGFALGAAVAVLYAPTAGSETRRRIASKTRESREMLAESGRELVEKGRELYDKGRHLADEAAEMFDEGRRLVEG